MLNNMGKINFMFLLIYYTYHFETLYTCLRVSDYTHWKCGLKNLASWLSYIFLEHKPTTNVFPGTRFAKEFQEWLELSF